MARRKDLPPGAAIGIVLLLWAAAVCAVLALHIYQWEVM